MIGTQTGAFTLQTATAIQTALQQAGFGTTGNIYYLNPANGSDNGPGTDPSTAFQTLGAAYAACAAGNNDVVVLIGNGATSGSARISANFTWAKNATHLVGICTPGQVVRWARIAPTLGITAFTNLFTISASGCCFANINWFHGFTVGVAASICLTVTGSDNGFINCSIQGMGDTLSAISSTSRSLVISGGGQENYFNHCYLGLDTIVRTNANATVEIAGGGPRNIFEDCIFPFWSSDGLQYGIYAAGAAALDRWLLLKGCQAVAGIGTAIAGFVSLAASVGGIVCIDATTNMYRVAYVGSADATTKAQLWLGGGTATNGVKGIVAT